MATIKDSLYALLLMAASLPVTADPGRWINTLNVQGIEPPMQTLEVPATQVSAYGDNAVEHCYVFPPFAAFETDTGQVGAESVIVRARTGEESPDQLCKMPGRPGDRRIRGSEGNVLGARGPFLFLTAADSFGAQGGLSVFDASNGKKLFDVRRTTTKPLKVDQADDGTVSLRYFLPLTLDCDLANASCWNTTLARNHVPLEALLVRPACEAGKKALLSTRVRVADVAHPQLVFENGQPACD